MQLLSSQREVHDGVVADIKAGVNRINIIGMAGTGKTVVGSEIVNTISRDKSINPKHRFGAIYVTAPTNKAVAVIQGKVQAKASFATIHSAIKITGYRNRAGVQVFQKSKSNPRYKNPFDTSKAAIIDESSMLNTQFVGGHVWVPNPKTGVAEQVYVPGWLEDYPFPIIFIGDDHQLNPVGEENSPIFHKGFKTYELTEIVRQGEGNPIIALSRDIDMLYFKQPQILNGKGYSYSNNVEMFVEGLAEVNGTDEMKYLGYTNDVVDKMNRMVRERIYKTPQKIEKNETLVFNKPIAGHYTNEEIKIEELEIITDNIPVPREDTEFDSKTQPLNGTDFIKMKYYRVNNSFNIVHEHSEKTYNTIYLTLKENYQKRGWDGRGYHFFEEQFADMKYNHAITVHKSQGSTYKETIVDIGDININQKPTEKQRLLYTAITRASDFVTFNNVK